MEPLSPNRCTACCKIPTVQAARAAADRGSWVAWCEHGTAASVSGPTRKECVAAWNALNPKERKGFGVYVASRTKHAAEWRGLRANGVPIVSTWIDEAGPGESPDLVDLWRRCEREVRNAACVVLLYDEGMEGALVEAGIAIASGVPVFVVGEPKRTGFKNHPGVLHADTLDDAFGFAYDVCGGWRDDTPAEPAP
jgi:hypothetical protein